MNFTFRPGDTLVVPDGTGLQEILGPRTMHNMHKPIVREVSTALGTLPPGVKSDIHVHPIVLHLTYVICGQLTVAMKDPESKEHYTIDLLPGETVLTRPCTLFQLINKSAAFCQALYIVAPSFVFETDANGQILYNDQIVLSNKTWEELKEVNYSVPELSNLAEIAKRREDSLERLSRQT